MVGKKCKNNYHIMPYPMPRGTRKRGGAIPVGAIWGAIPADLKRQLAAQLAKDFTTKVALPAAGLFGASKLYKRMKKK